MIESFNNKEAVRLIRSHKLGANNNWRPQEGFRYDGLYDVVSYKRLDTERRQRHQFKLIRKSGQDPIRGGIGAQSRPTPQEIEELHNHRRFSKGGD